MRILLFRGSNNYHMPRIDFIYGERMSLTGKGLGNHASLVNDFGERPRVEHLLNGNTVMGSSIHRF